MVVCNSVEVEVRVVVREVATVVEVACVHFWQLLAQKLETSLPLKLLLHPSDAANVEHRTKSVSTQFEAYVIQLGII